MESYNQLPAETCGSVVVVDLATGARCEGVDTAQVRGCGAEERGQPPCTVVCRGLWS